MNATKGLEKTTDSRMLKTQWRTMADEITSKDQYLQPGTCVRYDGLAEGGPEYGVVVHCWLNNEIDGFDCYVAFFGSKLPKDKPQQLPYILRYASSSLTVVEP